MVQDVEPDGSRAEFREERCIGEDVWISPESVPKNVDHWPLNMLREEQTGSYIVIHKRAHVSTHLLAKYDKNRSVHC